jgi:cell wall-associated NlpC family hydrolase
MGDLVEAAITVALTKLGGPNVWATAGPDTFDCSGFTWWVASQVLGPQDPELRSSHHQFNVWGQGTPGDWGQGTPGDWGLQVGGRESGVEHHVQPRQRQRSSDLRLPARPARYVEAVRGLPAELGYDV